MQPSFFTAWPTEQRAAKINAALPQTQCTRCGYPDCASYALAIATEQAALNQCPPGGAQGIARLADITGLPALPLNPAFGVESSRTVAIIDESWCIGCTLCIAACPTDAILGSNKRMHTVIEAHCTGCELCLPVCPVDCIALENASGEHTGWNAWSDDAARKAQSRYAFHSIRRIQDKRQSTKSAPRKKPLALAETQQPETPSPADVKQATIAAALARARAKRTPPAA